jgi:hypothetical protein
MIKRVFMLCVLAAGLLMQSCEDKTLTDLSVRYESLALPVGESVRIKVTFTPNDADNVQLVWSSSNESVATVKDGVVSFVGVGTAVITVSSGTISKTIHVEGTIRSLNVIVPEGTEIYVGAEFTLTVTPDPVDAQVSVVWSSDNEAVATVSPAGEVTVVGNGTANITATSGYVVGSYALICENLLESAVGYWEFDDPNDMVKAVKGEALTRMGNNIKWVEGPSAENLAIEVPMHEYFIASLKNAQPNGGPEGKTPTRVYRWTIMLDCRFPTVRSYYYTQHGGVNMGDGDFFVRWRDNQIQAGVGSYIIIGDAQGTDGYTSWLRLIMTFDNGIIRAYYNGVEASTSTGSYPLVNSIEDRFSLPVGNNPLYIFVEPKGTTADGKPNFAASDDDAPFPCAAIAFWDKVLSAPQVQALGGIAH